MQFLLDKEKNKPDAKLRFRIKWNGNIVAFNVGYRVDVAKWSPETQRCKVSTTHGKKKIQANVINKEITRFEQAAEDVFAYSEKHKIVPTADEFRTAFNKIIRPETKGKTTPKTFFTLFDDFVQEVGKRNAWSEKTYMKFQNIRNHLQIFNPNLTAEITDDDLQNFVDYQLSIPLRNSTIQKNISFTKWVLRWASTKGLYTGAAHENFKPKFKTVESKEIIYLTWDELINLYNFKFKQDYLERVRDVFCFCCFTGLRYSDVYKLKRTDIFDEYITVVTQKTADTLKIELNNYSKAILNKYEDYNFPNEKALPVISNQKMNNYLKEMGQVIGLNTPVRLVHFVGNKRVERVFKKWELLTTHCGRRTFVVNALALGIPAEVIIKWTGHADYSAMKPYIKIVDELKSKEMNKFNLVSVPDLKKRD